MIIKCLHFLNEALIQNDWIKELAFHMRTKVQIKPEARLSEPAVQIVGFTRTLYERWAPISSKKREKEVKYQ